MTASPSFCNRRVVAVFDLYPDPEYQTQAQRSAGSPKEGIVTHFAVTFPLALRVRAANGTIWLLTVNQRYFATNLDKPSQRKLQLEFTIASHTIESDAGSVPTRDDATRSHGELMSLTGNRARVAAFRQRQWN